MAETRTIRTVLELNAQRFNRGAASAAASAKALSGELAAIGDANGQARANYDSVANSLLGIGAAAATGLGLASKASMDWESAWAGVTKTVDGTEQQLATLEDGLRGLAKELPATHAEIAAVAEAAGQLGVETDSVVEFTRTMINLGETTNLSAEEAATGLARFSNIMGTSQDDVDRLGAAIVGLGNSYATTEAEILAMSMRLAGTGAQMDLTEGEVLGLATAMSSVGIEAEAGGTAMSMGMRKIDAAVREGGESLAGFAEVAGMTNDEFSKLWSEDSAAGLDAFVQGLAKVSAEGGDVSGVLSELGIKGIRESDTFLRLAGASDILSQALADGNTEFERNIALVEEAAKRYETTESQLKIARNALVDAGIDIGASVLPVLADVASGVSDLAGWFAALPEPVQRSVTQLGALAGATGLAAGGMMKLIPAAMDTVGAFRDLRTTSPRVASGLGKVGKTAGAAALAFGARAAAGAVAEMFSDVTISAEEMSSKLANLAATATVSAADIDELVAVTGTGGAKVKDFGYALESVNMNAFMKGLDSAGSAFGVFDSDVSLAKEQIASLDQALSAFAMAGTMDHLTETFNAAVDAAAEYGFTAEDVIAQMPGLRTALSQTATEMGLTADNATLAKIATGELSPVVDEATGKVVGYNTAQADAGDATSDTTGEVEDQVDALDELQDRLRTTSDLLLGVRGSELDFLDSVDAATDALDENGKVLDENGNLLNEMDEDARASRRALDEIAESTHAWIDSLPDDATAEQIDDIMSRGREQFIKTAESMGMSEEAAIRLADQMGLMPDFVETEVRVETEQAKADWAALWDELGYHPPEVPVGADTEPAEDEVVLFQGSVTSGDPTLAPVGADVEPAVWEVNALEEAINNSGGTVTINGNEVPADQVLGTLMGEINESDGTVTINGMSVPAELALSQAIGLINASGGTVTIEGNNKPAKSETDEAKRHADGTTGTIDVDANTGSANAAIDAAARSRTAYIQVIATGATSALRAGMRGVGFAEGGWLNAGLNAGGWVPGPYPGPGIDNVLWPVRSGLADGGMQMQPLAGTEFVVNGKSAQQWGPALEAINSGVSRSELAAMLGARPAGGSATYAPTFQGLTADQAVRTSESGFRHLMREQTAHFTSM